LREWSIVNVPALGQAKLEAALSATAAIEKWLGRRVAVRTLDLDDTEPVLEVADLRWDVDPDLLGRLLTASIVRDRACLGEAARLVEAAINRARGRVD
jgi:hypothetical protein